MPTGEYLTNVKSYYDLLDTAGHKVSESEWILTILSGLSEEYESLVTVVVSKKTLPYVHSTLLSYESRIEQKRSFNSNLIENYASNNKNKNQERTMNYRNDQNSQKGNQNFRGRERGSWNNINRIRYQFCEIHRHNVGKCYFRFDYKFMANQQKATIKGILMQT